jgi:hypothetical protein
MQGNTLLDLAEVLRLAGKAGDALPLVERAVGFFEQKGDRVSTARARRDWRR